MTYLKPLLLIAAILVGTIAFTFPAESDPVTIRMTAPDGTAYFNAKFESATQLDISGEVGDFPTSFTLRDNQFQGIIQSMGDSITVEVRRGDIEARSVAARAVHLMVRGDDISLTPSE